MLVLVAVFLSLGTWQVQRLFWKLDLIERVDARLHTDPVPPPGPTDWAGITAEKDEYRRVIAIGAFLHDKEVLVQAVTALGAGFWVVTPLQRPDGTTILINRGFVPEDRRDRASRTDGDVPGAVEISGLLRITEPNGAFLRTNAPQNDRWYSRDVAAITAAKGLANVAPYFIDAQSTPNAGDLPVGGLTVAQFRNSHLIYAITWYFLAAMSAAAAYAVLRRRIG
ncbi:SURF1 family protein [Neorhizobium alkalisoli]|uniref:SURF1 family protein n=1 Tax=Neorhizobium alkalisoli TaxID=528178 RepID=UPI000CF9F78C|nr:SURF1 family protein [Neorhizobium alkalisoli]